MSDEIVAIKGVRDGLLIALSPTEEWLKITTTLAARLDEQAEFYSGASITVDVGERPVPKYELSGLRALLERRGLVLATVQSSSETTRNSATALDVRVADLNSTPTADPGDDNLPNSEEIGTYGILVKRTLRSGRTIHSQGHVVVFGDVNPGAEIVAVGDVIIWGKLRGTVHAGVDGDTSAVVCALDMNPTQLRIANLIATSPKGKRRKIMPEAARIQDDQIIVIAWE
jgi:septum site-determining protein MinC